MEVLEESQEDDAGAESNGPLDLYTCLKIFEEEEELAGENAWYCPACKEHRPAKKTMDLWKVPPVLIVHLKRFSGSSRREFGYRGVGDKIECHVDFPVEGLDLSGYVKCPSDGEAILYDLFAVSNHFGGTGGGHCTFCYFSSMFWTN